MFPLFDNQHQRRPAVMVCLLMLASFAVFFYQLQLAREGALAAFIEAYAFTPALLVREPSPSRALTLLTSVFLHGHLLHIFGNMWFLWVFGRRVEARLGPFRFLAFYLLCGLAAALAQFLVGPLSAVPMLGASGAISGVLAAYFLLFPRAIILTFIPWIIPIIPVPAVVFIVLWFFLQTWQGMSALFATDVAGGVAWWAHIGGFVAGLWCLRLFKR